MDRNRRDLKNTVVGLAMATVMAFGVIAGLATASDAQVASTYDASVDATIADGW